MNRGSLVKKREKKAVGGEVSTDFFLAGRWTGQS